MTPGYHSHSKCFTVSQCSYPRSKVGDNAECWKSFVAEQFRRGEKAHWLLDWCRVLTVRARRAAVRHAGLLWYAPHVTWVHWSTWTTALSCHIHNFPLFFGQTVSWCYLHTVRAAKIWHDGFCISGIVEMMTSPLFALFEKEEIMFSCQ